ncbi:histidine phosphatase family protein [Methylobacterium organophilum]|uniref:histidine phosphatase family protein n=1 Tax=Methylobacterium organophilum TaxID=410 RepID=UPI001F1429A2|nr:histidine phosphatase family protein [Methylobacterium organophilum]UMY17795.1 histidine phosphatase family protein [Methylobacterium organophilum]
MRRVLLVRHARHDRLGRVLCGRMPGVSLSEAGHAEAEALARALAGRIGGVAQILSSPQARTRETAAPIARRFAVSVETTEALDEIDFGDWTGQPLAALEGDPAWTAWNVSRASTRPPGGEGMGRAQARAATLLDRLAAQDAPPAILVSHGDVIRAVLLGLLGLSLDAYDRLVIAPASWSELALWPGGGRIVSLNERVAP